jgi:regulator of CtrA degradation
MQRSVFQTGEVVQLAAYKLRRDFDTGVFKSLCNQAEKLVEEVAAYLHGPGLMESNLLTLDLQIVFATESFRLTSRMMQVMPWLELLKARFENNLTENAMRELKPFKKLDAVDTAEETLYLELPPDFFQLIHRSQELMRAVRRLDAEFFPVGKN